MAALVIVFLWSVVITGIGVAIVAVPLTLAINRIARGRMILVFLFNVLVGVGLAWLIVRQEGSVIDFTTLIGLHVGIAALIYAGVCLYQTKRTANA